MDDQNETIKDLRSKVHLLGERGGVVRIFICSWESAVSFSVSLSLSLLEDECNTLDKKSRRRLEEMEEALHDVRDDIYLDMLHVIIDNGVT